MKTLTIKERILHEKINLKGWNLNVSMRNLHDRIIRKDKKSAYSKRGLICLHNTLTNIITEPI